MKNTQPQLDYAPCIAALEKSIAVARAELFDLERANHRHRNRRYEWTFWRADIIANGEPWRGWIRVSHMDERGRLNALCFWERRNDPLRRASFNETVLHDDGLSAERELETPEYQLVTVEEYIEGRDRVLDLIRAMGRTATE